mmetsp:Transcript_42814/g.103154  ORF Transcript_42814/g.103154 Transcript_42814/m.103154 type:complete len:230 (-) Transcript_42814:74-763(-)
MVVGRPCTPTTAPLPRSTFASYLHCWHSGLMCTSCAKVLRARTQSGIPSQLRAEFARSLPSTSIPTREAVSTCGENRGRNLPCRHPRTRTWSWSQSRMGSSKECSWLVWLQQPRLHRSQGFGSTLDSRFPCRSMARRLRPRFLATCSWTSTSRSRCFLDPSPSTRGFILARLCRAPLSVVGRSWVVCRACARAVALFAPQPRSPCCGRSPLASATRRWLLTTFERRRDI